MPDTTTTQSETTSQAAPAKSPALMQPEHHQLKRRFPTALDLRARARKRARATARAASVGPVPAVPQLASLLFPQKLASLAPV